MGEQALTLNTIEKMKEMAAEPLKAAAIAQDETLLGGLVMVLSNKDHNIVNAALQTLDRLCDAEQNRPVMRQSLGMMEQLQTLTASDDTEVSALASKVFSNLDLTAQPASYQTPLREASKPNSVFTTRPASTAQLTINKKRRNSFFLGGVKRCKTVILQVRGMDHKDDVELCRNTLLTVPGVVSITFEYKKHRAVIRAKPEVPPEKFADAISKTMTMSVQHVVKDEHGNEVLVSIGAATPRRDKENDEQMPDYPSDDNTSPIRPDNVARVGATPGPEQGGGWGFVKSVGSFLSTSFYW